MVLFFFFFKQKTAYEMRISDWSSDVCSSDLRRQAERRRTCRTGMEQWGTVEMGVADGARPDRRQRHQMREVQRVDQGLPDVRVNLPWQRRQPRDRKSVE